MRSPKRAFPRAVLALILAVIGVSSLSGCIVVRPGRAHYHHGGHRW
jgi:hypothetical protein